MENVVVFVVFLLATVGLGWWWIKNRLPPKT